ncbi:MAG TPA: YicC/YloC family endoribonuclease [Candidatus Acidoferrum sp.]|nr:YicC/YloC family endoribonuclease [Candidatus Acidoferrum sp.]
MKSMTGYGWGEAVQNGFKVTVELSSVNRKQSEISVNLPRELEVLEAQLRDEVNRRIARGRVTARVTLHTAEKANSNQVRINTALATAYTKKLRALAKELKLAGDVTLDHLVRAPGVFESDDDVPDAEDFWPAVDKALKIALEMMVGMRQKEGAHLRADLVKRIERMRKAAQRVEKQAPEIQVRYRKQLLDRIRSAGIEAAKIEEERVLKEIIFFADRSDISEEITRLQSHFKQFDDCVNSREPVGRTLDFLAQEMNREINTIGSKANDATISREVVVLKTELEKFREQAQNVE